MIGGSGALQPKGARPVVESERILATGVGQPWYLVRLDLAHAEWEKRIESALATFESAPTILQKFHKGKTVRAALLGCRLRRAENHERPRAPLSVLLVEPDKVKMRGALATIVPADKKFLHGMRDAILAPTSAQN